VGSVIATLADASLNDQFPHTKCEERREIVGVAVAAILTNSVSGTASWLVEIQGDLITLRE